jgi:ATP-dependent exoDNAse (exonuclease V) beta subunit
MGLSLIKMIEDIDCEALNPSLTKDGLFVRLYDKLFEERNKMMTAKGLNKNEASLSLYITSMYDSIITLSILAERCRTKKELIRHIERIFKEESEGICLSTVHKAKGLESDNVYILCHSQMPSKLAKKEWEKQQERNLQYVAYTRPRMRLGFISENEVAPSGMSNEPIAIINDLHNIEVQVCRILGKTPTERVEDVELAKFRVKTATKVDLPQEEDNSVNLDEDFKNEDNNDLLSQLSEFIMKDKENINKLKDFLKG